MPNARKLRGPHSLWEASKEIIRATVYHHPQNVSSTLVYSLIGHHHGTHMWVTEIFQQSINDLENVKIDLEVTNKF